MDFLADNRESYREGPAHELVPARLHEPRPGRDVREREEAAIGMGVAARAVGDEERERERSRLKTRVDFLDSDEATGLHDSGEAALVVINR